jgi:hypothetical protein
MIFKRLGVRRTSTPPEPRSLRPAYSSVVLAIETCRAPGAFSTDEAAADGITKKAERPRRSWHPQFLVMGAVSWMISIAQLIASLSAARTLPSSKLRLDRASRRAWINASAHALASFVRPARAARVPADIRALISSRRIDTSTFIPTSPVMGQAPEHFYKMHP